MNLFRITFYNQFEEFLYYLLSDKYPGNENTIKLLIENEMNISFDVDLWKEFKENNPNYKLDYEIIQIEQIDNVLKNKL